MEPIRVFIVEDQPVILRTEEKLLAQFEDIVVVGTGLSGEEAVDKMKIMVDPPDVVLCDIGLPKMSGIQVVRKIRRRHEKTEFLMFTVFDEEHKVLEAVQAGAAGYLLKGASADKIVESIRDIHQGGSAIQPNLAKSLLKYFRMPEEGLPPSGMLMAEERERYGIAPEEGKRALTERELECLQMIAKGLSNNEAALVLGLSKATIRTHLEHIYQKLDVTNRVEAVTEGIRQGIIEI